MTMTLHRNLSMGWARRTGRLVWCLRQLLPLTYRTTYLDSFGNRHFTVWRMWFGRCFHIDDVICQPSTEARG